MKILVDNKQKCGVYKIKNLINNKCYIGSTSGFLKYRAITHRYNLRYNKHTNQHLQNAWNKYGENNFEFSLVELCNINECIIREQYHIDTLTPEYNIAKLAGSTLGYKHTDEAKKKISIASAGRNHPAYSGEYVFYHPIKGYIINDRINFSKSQQLKKVRIHKLCEGILNQHRGWICLGKYENGFLQPTNIDEIYQQKIHITTPIRIFYNKKFGVFIGQIKDILQKFNLNRSGFVGLCNNTRQSNCGWIHLGIHTKNFKLPNNINEIYDEKISLNTKIKNLPNQIISTKHKNGDYFTGTIQNFSNKYNLHLRCVIRLYNGGRKQYKGWEINKIDENKEME